MKKELFILAILIFPFSVFANSMIQQKISVGFCQIYHGVYYEVDGIFCYYPGAARTGCYLGHETIEYIYEFDKKESFLSPIVGGGIGLSFVGITGYGIGGVSLNFPQRTSKSLLQLRFTGELGGGGFPVLGYGFFLAENADLVISKKNRKEFYGGLGIGIDEVIYPTSSSILPVYYYGEVHVFAGVRL